MGLKNVESRAAQLPYVGCLVRAYLQSRDHYQKDMSASIAYFSFLSIFPLIIGVIAVGTLFLDSSEVRLRLDNFIVNAVPGSATLIIENIDNIVRLRGPVGFISFGVLIWSASKMVGAMVRGINVSLGLKRNYAFFLSPLRNSGLTLSVSFLLLIAMSISPLADIVSELSMNFFSDSVRAYLDVIASRLMSFAITLIVLASIYLIVPYKRPPWPAVWPGALVAAILFELGRSGFLLYVGNAARFDAVYGSLSSIIVLLIWLYFSARFLLYGSEVIGVLRHDRAMESDAK